MSEKQIVCYLEVRPLLRLANVILCSRNRGDLTNNVTVTITTNEISITFTDDKNESEKRTLKLDGVLFVPNSCSGLCKSSWGLNLRLQLPESLQLKDSNSEPKKGVVVKRETPYVGCCIFCGVDILLPNVSFDRVLPLPQEWALDFAPEWFCHSHGGEEFDLSGKLQPSNNDCLLGEGYLVLNSDILDVSALDVQKDGIRCKRCTQLLGDVHSASDDGGFAARLYNDSFRLQPKEADVDKINCDISRIFLEEDSGDTWCSFLGHYSRACRLVIECSHETEVADQLTILVQLMDSSVIHLISELTDTENEIAVDKCKRKKILYIIEKEKSNLVTEWKSGNVEFHSLSYTSFMAFANKLVNKTKSLPHLMQKIDKFWIAYI